MTVYFRYRTVAGNAEERFVLDLKKETVTSIGFFVDNPSFEFECSPLFQKIPDANPAEKGDDFIKKVESGFYIPAWYKSDNPLKFRVKDSSGVANTYLLLVVTGTGNILPNFTLPFGGGGGGGSPF